MKISLIVVQLLSTAVSASPVDNVPDSGLMLDLPGTGQDPTKIDYTKLPVLEGQHAIVSLGNEEWRFRLHNYLTHYAGKYWCFWSHGPVIEDKARQHLRYSTSEDGLKWTKPQILQGPPREGYGYIARGLWKREGELIALASLFEAPGFSGGDLSLEAFRWDRSSAAWKPAGTIRHDSMNNFPPKKLPDGNWMMSRRNAQRDVSVMIGGVKAIDQWMVIPLAAYDARPGQRPEEPYWYVLPDGKTIVGLFRNNDKSRRLLRAFSTDNGRTWSKLIKTNFPDARSKFNSVRTNRGDYVLISNTNPRARYPLCLSVSADGLVYTRMARLPIPDKIPHDSWEKSKYGSTKYESMQYPHVIEHDGSLLIAFSRKKQTVEVVKLPLQSIGALRER